MILCVRSAEALLGKARCSWLWQRSKLGSVISDTFSGGVMLRASMRSRSTCRDGYIAWLPGISIGGTDPDILNHMVEYIRLPLDRTFHALSHPIRREILARLATERATVLDIAAPFDISLNGVSKHLKVLEEAGLITREVRGREHYCALKPERLQ